MNTQDIQKAFKGKKDFYPSKKLRKMIKVKKLFITDEANSYFKDTSTGSKTVEAMKMVKSLGLSDDVMIVDLDRKK